LTPRGAAENMASAQEPMPVAKFYFEDFKPGLFGEYGPRLITREEIVAFAAEFDPQPMHLDEDAGA
jgi:acyl dehydratase